MAAGSGTVHKLTVPERSGLCQVAKSIYYAGFKEDRRLGDDWPHGTPPRVCTVHELTVPQRSSPNPVYYASFRGDRRPDDCWLTDRHRVYR